MLQPTIVITKLSTKITSESLKQGVVRTEYHTETGELVLTFRLNHQASEVVLRQGVVEVQIEQIRIGFDDDAIRYLVNSLPPDMIH